MLLQLQPFEVFVDQTDCQYSETSNWERLLFIIIGHVCMDGTPVDNNRLVLVPFLKHFDSAGQSIFECFTVSEGKEILYHHRERIM